jgi:hypothetical protein
MLREAKNVLFYQIKIHCYWELQESNSDNVLFADVILRLKVFNVYVEHLFSCTILLKQITPVSNWIWTLEFNLNGNI